MAAPVAFLAFIKVAFINDVSGAARTHFAQACGRRRSAAGLGEDTIADLASVVALLQKGIAVAVIFNALRALTGGRAKSSQSRPVASPGRSR